MRLYFFLLVLLSVTFSSTNAQNCSDILSGLIDYSSLSFDTEFWRRYKQEIDDKKFNSNESFRDHNNSIGATIPIEGIPVGFNFGSKGKVTRGSKTYDSFSRLIEDDSEFRESFQSEFRIANEGVIREWGKCMRQERFITWTTINGKYLSLHLVRGKFDDPPILTIENVEFSTDNLELISSKSFKGLEIGSSPKVIRFRIKDRLEPSFITVTTNSNSYTANHEIRALVPDTKKPSTSKPVPKPKLEPIEICTCNTKGGYSGQKYWGPKGEPCWGLVEWGTYCEDCRLVTEVGKANGAGGLSNITFYGPIGEHVGGLESWPKYGGVPIKVGRNEVENARLFCSCKPRGGFSSFTFWGPNDEYCAGIAQWGFYNFSCRE